jgi:polysaccharide biosynthesis PFTS motif protein
MFNKYNIFSYFKNKTFSVNKIKLYNRSYKNFIKIKKLYIFRLINGELKKTNLIFDKVFFNILVFFYPKFRDLNLNISIAQYVYQRFNYRKLNLKILLSKEKNFPLSYPVPSEYYKILSNNKVQISLFKCKILWFLFCLIHWSYGNYIIFKILFNSLINLCKKKEQIDLYFFNINKKNLPFDDNYKKRISYDLVSWFIKYFEKNNFSAKSISCDNKKIENICKKNMKVFYSDHPYLYIKNFFLVIYFFILSLFFSILSFFFLLVGRWQSSFMFGEIVKSIAFIKADKNKLSKVYLFHYSETVYRPLWTYFDKEFKLKILLYFYSTYDSPTDFCNPKIDRSHEYSNISWQNILVWDERHNELLSKHINKTIKNSKIEIVGPIWFNDKKFIFDTIKFRILIFDNEVGRNSIHFGWGELAEYNKFNKNLNHLFLYDIYNVFKDKNVEIIFKRKREDKNSSKTSYKNLILKLKQNPKFVEIDPDVSPQYLIENAKIVISSPFTSANLYSTKKETKNIYYDPISYVNKSDPAARGLSVICGFEELKEWEKNIIYN